jgi:ubiquinone/menaquinone biosynthesis C-methylase UbiE
MPLSAHDWHRRFTLQSRWTLETRKYLYDRSGTLKSKKILDVGCGTGAISQELVRTTGSDVTGLDINQDFIEIHTTGIDVTGLDINQDFIEIADADNPSANFLLADAHRMPIESSIFDICLCHFLLLWVETPIAVINEMKRVTKSGGAILVLAEPDYGGRIDFPYDLSILNDWQTESLRNQGANPTIGRELKSILHQSGLMDIEVGVVGAQWTGVPSQQEISSEWEIILSDLGYLKNLSEVMRTSEEIRKNDYKARASGDRVLYVPTFYAWGRVAK